MGCCLSSVAQGAAAPPATAAGGQQAHPPGAMFTADVLVFHFGPDRSLQLLTITRANPPFRGRLALPGGFVEAGEDSETAAARELAEETGVDGLCLVHVGTFDRPGRDPRGPVITNAYFAFSPNLACQAGSDARSARFQPVMPLASKGWSFDHAEIVATALTVASEHAEAGTLETYLPLEAAAAHEPLKQELRSCLASFLAAASEGAPPAQGENDQPRPALLES